MGGCCSTKKPHKVIKSDLIPIKNQPDYAQSPKRRNDFSKLDPMQRDSQAQLYASDDNNQQGISRTVTPTQSQHVNNNLYINGPINELSREYNDDSALDVPD